MHSMGSEPSVESSRGLSDTAAEGQTERPLLRYRLAFFGTALITLALVVTLPFSVKSVVDDVLGSATGRVIPITPRGSGLPETNHTKLHLAVTSIDEVQLLA